MTTDFEKSYQEAKTLFTKSKFKDAQQKFEQILPHAPSDEIKADILCYKGRCLIFCSKNKDSIKDLEDAVNLHTKRVFLKSWLAYSNKLNNNVTKANILYQEIIEFCNEKEKFKQLDEEEYISRGNAKTHIENYTQAIKDYKEAIKKKPDYNLAYLLIGIAEFYLNKDTDAINNFKEALKINPNYAIAYFNLGIIYRRINKYDLALNNFEKAIQLNPDYADSYLQLAKMKYLSKEYELAYTYVKKTFEFDKENEKAQALESKITFAISQREYEKLKDSFKKDSTFTSISNTLNKNSNWNYWFYIILRATELIIYGLLICYAFVKAPEFFDKIPEDLNKLSNNDYFKNNQELIIPFFIVSQLWRLVFIIPAIWAISLINQTANRFSQRSEFDTDTAINWRFLEKIELELKDTPDNDALKQVYINALTQTIEDRKKTAFERLEEVISMNKHPRKNVNLKQINPAIETLKKAIDIVKDIKPETKEPEKT